MALEVEQPHKRHPAFCVVAAVFFLVNGLTFHRHWDKGSMRREGERLGWRGKLEGKNEFVGHATKSSFIYPKNKIWIGPVIPRAVSRIFLAFFDLKVKHLFPPFFIWDHKQNNGGLGSTKDITPRIDSMLQSRREKTFLPFRKVIVTLIPGCQHATE